MRRSKSETKDPLLQRVLTRKQTVLLRNPDLEEVILSGSRENVSEVLMNTFSLPDLQRTITRSMYRTTIKPRTTKRNEDEKGDQGGTSAQSHAECCASTVEEDSSVCSALASPAGDMPLESDSEASDSDYGDYHQEGVPEEPLSESTDAGEEELDHGRRWWTGIIWKVLSVFFFWRFLTARQSSVVGSGDPVGSAAGSSTGGQSQREPTSSLSGRSDAEPQQRPGLTSAARNLTSVFFTPVRGALSYLFRWNESETVASEQEPRRERSPQRAETVETERSPQCESSCDQAPLSEQVPQQVECRDQGSQCDLPYASERSDVRAGVLRRMVGVLFFWMPVVRWLYSLFPVFHYVANVFHFITFRRFCPVSK